MRTPTELINLYWNEVWNNGNVELIREICADPLIRHDAGSVTALSHEEQIKRVSQSRGRLPLFTHEVLLADDQYVCSVWNMTVRTGGERQLCGIEVFKVDAGRLSHAWNSSYVPGRWGREGDTSVPDMLPPPDLIASSRQVDRDWIQRVLKAAGLAAPYVGDVYCEPIGNGTVGDTFRVHLTYNGDATGMPTKLVCKFDGKSDGPAALNRRLNMYVREVKSFELLSREAGMPVPQLFFARTSDDGASANIVMQDLGAIGRPGDQIAGCSVAEADTVVDALARVHAAFFEDGSLPGLDWTLKRSARAADLSASYALGADAMRARLGPALTPAQYAVIDGFRELYADWAAWQPMSLTFIHGDPRVDNVMFGQDGGEPKAWLLDWALSDAGDPQYDLAYFLGGSVSVVDRRQNDRRWLRAHVTRIQSKAPHYTLASAEAAFRLNGVAGLAATVGAARSIAQSEHNDRLLEALVQRNCAMVTDWDSLEAIRQGCRQAHQ